jgi:hypothetical protein
VLKALKKGWEMRDEDVRGGCAERWKLRNMSEKGWEMRDEDGGMCWEMEIEKHGRERLRVKMGVGAVLRWRLWNMGGG